MDNVSITLNTLDDHSLSGNVFSAAVPEFCSFDSTFSLDNVLFSPEQRSCWARSSALKSHTDLSLSTGFDFNNRDCDIDETSKSIPVVEAGCINSTFKLSLVPWQEYSHTHDGCGHAHVPNSVLKTAVEWPQVNSLFEEYLHLHRCVVMSGTYNFCGCRSPVPSKLNIPVWRELLALENYHDQEICELLQYGFPIGYHVDFLPK